MLDNVGYNLKFRAIHQGDSAEVTIRSSQEGFKEIAREKKGRESESMEAAKADCRKEGEGRTTPITLQDFALSKEYSMVNLRRRHDINKSINSCIRSLKKDVLNCKSTTNVYGECKRN